MNTPFADVVDLSTDGLMSPDFYFKQQQDQIGCAVTFLRIVGCLSCILGFYLLFAPIIGLVAWIPLVGTLLSSVIGFAALLFASIVGLTLSITTIALAWVFFRPVVGASLLALVALSTYYTFYFEYTGSESGELNTP